MTQSFALCTSSANDSEIRDDGNDEADHEIRQEDPRSADRNPHIGEGSAHHHHAFPHQHILQSGRNPYILRPFLPTSLLSASTILLPPLPFHSNSRTLDSDPIFGGSSFPGGSRQRSSFPNRLHHQSISHSTPHTTTGHNSSDFLRIRQEATRQEILRIIDSAMEVVDGDDEEW